MSANIEKIKAAPFLVSSSKKKDFTTIVAPDYICDAGIHDLLKKIVTPYNQPTDAGKAIHVGISTSKVGTIFAVFYTTWAIEKYIGGQGDDILRDLKGRAIPFIAGFIFKEPITDDSIASINFEIAQEQVIKHYQDFWQSPQPVQKSEYFNLQIDKDSTQKLRLVRTKFLPSLETPTGQLWHCISTLNPDSSPHPEICSLAFSPGGKSVVARYNDQTVRLWNWSEQKIKLAWDFRTTEKNVSSIVFSPNGETIVTAVFDNSGENIIKLLNSQTGDVTNIYTNSQQAICSITMRVDSKWLVSGSDDKTLKLWNLPKKRYHCKFDEPGRVPFFGYPSSGSIKSVAISPDGEIIVSGDEDGYIRSRGIRHTDDSKDCVRASSNSINHLAFSPNGKMIASANADGKIKFFKVNNLEEIRTIIVNSPVNSVAFSPSGQILASGSDDVQLEIWDVNKGELIETLRGHKGGVTSVAFSVDGSIASGSKDGTIKIWSRKA